MREIVVLKTLLTSNPVEAVEYFNQIVKEGNDETIEEACQSLANYIRFSSVYKRILIFSTLQNTSFLSRIYLSFQFHSFTETSFPRRLVFRGRSIFENKIDEVQLNVNHRHHVMAVGSNRFFNLGVISDGSPVEEPHLVSVPHVVDIKMSNTHTVFMTSDNRIFGCGKAASFLPDRIEETEGGYVALPVEVNIPKLKKAINEVRVTEGGTQIRAGDTWYLVGKSPFAWRTDRISTNCTYTSQNHDLPTQEIQHAMVHLNDVPVRIVLKVSEGQILWDKNDKFPSAKKVEVLVNGIPDDSYLESSEANFRVLDDGTTYVAKNGLFKGRLEFWKNKDDGFTVKNGTFKEHFDTKYTLVALLEEVPGTIGTRKFAVSPDGQNVVMAMGYTKEYATEDVPQFFSSRPDVVLKIIEEQGDLAELPSELTIRYFQKETRTDVEIPMNRTIFEMMYSVWIGSFSDDYFESNPDRCWRPNSNNPDKEFIPNNTEPSFIWYFLTTDKKRVACHKNPLLMFSRQIVAMQRFKTTTYGCYNHEKTDDKPVEIDTNATEKTVRNALRGLFNVHSLFDIKTIELIECINFYDYHLMEEMFDDAFEVLMETVNEFTLPLLFELFYSFGEKVAKGLELRPYLLYNSISTIRPPKELLKMIVQNIEEKWDKRGCLKELENFESEEIVKYFLDLNQDSEDVVWLSISRDFPINLEKAKIEAMRRKENKRVVKSRNNRHSFRTDQFSAATSSPIEIRDRTINKSFSNSISSPIESFSKSPTTTQALPIIKNNPRTNSISNSLDDFPEMSPSSSSVPTSSKGKFGGRFVPKGTKFVNANQILMPTSPVNRWKSSKEQIKEEDGLSSFFSTVVNFEDVVRSEEKLQRHIKKGIEKVQLLPHVETEELAISQILEVFKREYQDEALILVDLIESSDLNVEKEQMIWGDMPGLVRRS